MAEITVTVSTNVDTEELAELISSQIPCSEVADFLRLVEGRYEDWGVAEHVAKTYVKTVVDFLVDFEADDEDMGWKEEFKQFLLEQANRI